MWHEGHTTTLVSRLLENRKMRDERNVFQLENLEIMPFKNFGDNLGCWLKKIFKKGIVPKISSPSLFQVVLLEGAILWVDPGVH